MIGDRMDSELIYIRTEKGEKELGNDQLPLELHDILSRIDGRTGVGRMMQDASFWTEQTFESSLKELLETGCIRQFVPDEGVKPDEAPPQELPAEESFSGTGKSKFARTTRTLIASVLFLDIVEYTRKSVADQFRIKEDFNRLVYELVQRIPEDDRIIVDTGDGAALGFLADPEEVLAIAIELRDTLEENGHRNHPDLYVRMGINLGPVKLVADMNGRENLIGDGVNDANRVMGFAKGDQILVSRSFYDVVSRLSGENQGLFKYQGIHKDKHRREHEIYEVAGGEKAVLDEKIEARTEEEIKAERLEKMKAKLEAAAKAEAEAKAAQDAREKLREAHEAEMRKKAEARILAEKAAQPKRRKSPARAILIALAVLLLVVAGVLPFVPLEFVARNAAARIANQTQETVSIESASFSLLPTPRINLKQVSMGNLRIDSMAELLLEDAVLVEGVTAEQDTLPKISGWGGISRNVELRKVSLSLNGKRLPVFGAKVELGGDGSFRHARIDSEGMNAEITPRDSGFQIELAAKNWKLPFGPDCPWTEVHASAYATDGEAKITSVEATGYGGEWSGSGRISWSKGWRGSIRFKGKNLDVAALMPFFSRDAKANGTLDFDAQAASSAAGFAELFDAPHVSAEFRARDGVLGNVDIAQAIKAPSSEGTRGGETKFEDLSGSLSISGNDYRFGQIRLTSGLMKASGDFSVQAGKVSGRMEVLLNQMRSSLSFGGSLADPVVR